MATEEKKNQNNLTIGDVADALGISKTTVSRAISGKGRIGEATRKKVLEYIDTHNYKPSPLAKGLANSLTYNICWAMPGDSTVTDLPFFQNAMIGIEDVAMAEDYDVIISLIYEDDISQLKRIVENRKVDGVILGRTLSDDLCVRYLKEQSIPFVVIGSSTEKGVVQIDNDHVNACNELTSILLMKGIRHPALIGGSLKHVVNCTRLKGYKKAFTDKGLNPDEDLIIMNCEETADIERAADQAIRSGSDCLICTDDRICSGVLNKLSRDGISIPSDIKVASFYNSTFLDYYQPAVTALNYDPRELGAAATRTLFAMLKNEPVEEKTYLSYEVLLKRSTQV